MLTIGNVTIVIVEKIENLRIGNLKLGKLVVAEITWEFENWKFENWEWDIWKLKIKSWNNYKYKNPSTPQHTDSHPSPIRPHFWALSLCDDVRKKSFEKRRGQKKIVCLRQMKSPGVQMKVTLDSQFSGMPSSSMKTLSGLPLGIRKIICLSSCLQAPRSLNLGVLSLELSFDKTRKLSFGILPW